jgi:hypothetical protein
MVKTRLSEHARIVRNAVKDAIDNIFGRRLVLRKVTRTVDSFGQISTITTTDTTFKGDLQFGVNLDQKFVESGIVEVGEGVLYLHPTELSTLPSPQDQIIDGNAVWEIVDRIESPEMGGDAVFYTFRCRRRINSGD